MTTTTGNVPTLSQELNRKAFNALNKIYQDFELGKVTKAQMKYAHDILWEALPGLIDAENFNILQHIGEKAKSASYAETIVYLNEDTGAVVKITDSRTGLVVVKTIKKGEEPSISVFDKRQEPNPYLSAKQVREQLHEGFTLIGFKLL